MMVGVWQGLGLDCLPETFGRYLMGSPWVIGIASWLFIRVIRYSRAHILIENVGMLMRVHASMSLQGFRKHSWLCLSYSCGAHAAS